MKLITPETTLFRAAMSRMNKQNIPFLSLGLGEPEIETPDFIKEAACRALADGYTRYSSPLGLESLREAVSQKLREQNQIDASPDQVLITPGAKNALFVACLGLLEAGDEVLSFTPAYVSYAPILAMVSQQIHFRQVELKYPDFSIDWDQLSQAITDKTRLILLNFPHNPTGMIFPADAARRLASLIAGKNIWVLSDEVYDQFVFSGANCSPASLPDLKDQVITVNSLSKSCFMTGWRIGYLHGPADLIQSLAKINLHLNTNVATFTQMAALAALTVPNTILDDYRTVLEKRRSDGLEFLNEIDSEFLLPPAGLFVFLNLVASGLKSDPFAAQLLESKQVAVAAGLTFGPAYDNFCRISFACRTEDYLEGLQRIRDFIKELQS
jgi:aspartate/methionine/tyrosine aminotransferase